MRNGRSRRLGCCQPRGPRFLGIENTGAPIEDRRATSVTPGAEHVDAALAIAIRGDDGAIGDTESVDAALPDPRQMLPPATPPVQIASASTPDPVQDDVEAAARLVEVADMGSVDAALPDPRQMLPPATPPVRLASLFTSDPVKEDPKPVVRPVETLSTNASWPKSASTTTSGRSTNGRPKSTRTR